MIFFFKLQIFVYSKLKMAAYQAAIPEG